MKKRGYIGRLAALAMVLSLVTMSLTAGTLAKYASSVSGTATAVVAKWNVAFKDGSNTYDGTSAIELSDTVNSNAAKGLVAEKRVAPGTSGSFALAVDGQDTEVAFDYTITLKIGAITEGKNTLSTKAPIKFYSDAAHSTPLTSEGSGTDEVVKTTGQIKTTDSPKTKTIDVYWVWDSTGIAADGKTSGSGTDADEKAAATDVVDTALGKEFDTFTIPVEISATQTLPTT